MNLFYILFFSILPLNPIQTNHGFQLEKEHLIWNKIYEQDFSIDSQEILLDPAMFLEKYPKSSEWMKKK